MAGIRHAQSIGSQVAVRSTLPPEDLIEWLFD
jgi:hypothetical protein